MFGVDIAAGAAVLCAAAPSERALHQESVDHMSSQIRLRTALERLAGVPEGAFCGRSVPCSS
jgi:hypothetical protein